MQMKTLRHACLAPVGTLGGLLLGASALAQELPAHVPSKEGLARNNKLFITLASKYLKWEEPAEPAKIVGSLYFVGTQGLSSWLFATQEGHILLNTGMPSSGPMIVESIRKLGFKPEDIKIIINGHGHSDHAGAFAFIKQLTGAQIAVQDRESTERRQSNSPQKQVPHHAGAPADAGKRRCACLPAPLSTSVMRLWDLADVMAYKALEESRSSSRTISRRPPVQYRSPKEADHGTVYQSVEIY